MSVNSVEELINEHYEGDEEKFFKGFGEKLTMILENFSTGMVAGASSEYVKKLKEVYIKINNKELPTWDDLYEITILDPQDSRNDNYYIKKNKNRRS